MKDQCAGERHERGQMVPPERPGTPQAPRAQEGPCPGVLPPGLSPPVRMDCVLPSNHPGARCDQGKGQLDAWTELWCRPSHTWCPGQPGRPPRPMPCLGDGLHGDTGPSLGGLSRLWASVSLTAATGPHSPAPVLANSSTLSPRLDSCKDAGITMTHVTVTLLSQRPSAGARVTE